MILSILDALQLVDLATLIFLILIVFKLYRFIDSTTVGKRFNRHLILFAACVFISSVFILLDYLYVDILYSVLSSIVTLLVRFYILSYLYITIHKLKLTANTQEFLVYVKAMDDLIYAIKNRTPTRNVYY